jgi:hypothetical protein
VGRARTVLCARVRMCDDSATNGNCQH